MTSETDINFSPGFLSLLWNAKIESQANTALLKEKDIEFFEMV